MEPRIRSNRHMPRFVRASTLMAIVGVTLTPGPLESQAAGGRGRVADLGIRWIEVEGGTFTMGSDNSARQVTVGRFMMSATEITFDQYDAFCDATGKVQPDDNGWGRGTRPVLNVSFDDAVEFAEWLSQETGSAVQLPTEAEWEYAAQGGRYSRGFIHSGGNDKDEVSWNEDNSLGRTHPVGTKKPNELGLFDMSGSLWEWCADAPDVNPTGSQAEPRDAGSDLKRAVRGDSFDNPGSSLGFKLSVRLDRDSRHYNIGFRVVKKE